MVSASVVQTNYSKLWSWTLWTCASFANPKTLFFTNLRGVVYAYKCIFELTNFLLRGQNVTCTHDFVIWLVLPAQGARSRQLSCGCYYALSFLLFLGRGPGYKAIFQLRHAHGKRASENYLCKNLFLPSSLTLHSFLLLSFYSFLFPYLSLTLLLFSQSWMLVWWVLASRTRSLWRACFSTVCVRVQKWRTLWEMACVNEIAIIILWLSGWVKYCNLIGQYKSLIPPATEPWSATNIAASSLT